jgi:hypothetical protein
MTFDDRDLEARFRHVLNSSRAPYGVVGVKEATAPTTQLAYVWGGFHIPV